VFSRYFNFVLKSHDLATAIHVHSFTTYLPPPGADVVAALENGVSGFPKLEGRFPQLAGCRFVFDPSKPPGQRVEPALVQVQDEDIDLNKVQGLSYTGILY